MTIRADTEAAEQAEQEAAALRDAEVRAAREQKIAAVVESLLTSANRGRLCELCATAGALHAAAREIVSLREENERLNQFG